MVTDQSMMFPQIEVYYMSSICSAFGFERLLLFLPVLLSQQLHPSPCSGQQVSDLQKLLAEFNRIPEAAWRTESNYRFHLPTVKLESLANR